MTAMLPPLKKAAKMGRDGDTMIAHINPAEAEFLRMIGGSGTRNPHTGLLEFGGGGGTINGAGGSGNVSGGGRGNTSTGGGRGNRGPGVDRVNDKLGTQHQSWQGAAGTTSWGAPVHPGKYGNVALSPEAWGALTDQVDDYNAAANKWNAGAHRSFANFVNAMEPFGLSMQAPEFSKPKTYVGGDYHLGLNPATLAGSILGGATMIPGAGTAAGFLAGKAYEMSGMPNVMLGGGPVPAGWRKDLPMGPGSNTTPQNNPGFRGTPTQTTAPAGPAGRTTAQGTPLLPPIAGNGVAPIMAAAQPTIGLPPVTTRPPQVYPGGFQSVPGPTPYGWTRPAWAA